MHSIHQDWKIRYLEECISTFNLFLSKKRRLWSFLFSCWLKVQIYPLTMLQVAKPVESIKQCKCGRKDNSWDFVNLRDRIKSFFGIVHGTSDASFALTFVCSILISIFIIVVFSIVPFPTFGPVHHNASFWRVIWRLARRCSANIQFRIQQKKSKVWLTLPYVFLKAFKKCRRGERKRNRGNPFAIVAAAASLSILYVNKCIISSLC